MSDKMEKVDNYEIYKNKELGRGSFSIVYLGKYTGPDNNIIKNNKEVAIKKIKMKNIFNHHSLKAKEILNEELNIMEFIKFNPHPNIVKCFDIIRNPDSVYIILEYCDSGDLRTILKKPILEKYTQFYFCQLANGLKYLDNHGIIHRDIKPKNILLTKNKKKLKIADFGFAKKINTNYNLHDTICGSPLYMAPEIVDKKAYNNQTDLWSIGMILYEMLFGFHPFNKCTTFLELETVVSKDTIEIPPPNSINKSISEPCLSLLRYLLQKDVNKRITWNDFFEHPWILEYIGEKSDNKSVNPSTSNKSNSPNIVKDSPNKNFESNTPKSYSSESPSPSPSSYGKGNPLNKISSIIASNTVEIIEDYRRPKNDEIQEIPDEEFIFDMELDNKKTDKIIIQHVVEKSSLLDDNEKNYEIIDSTKDKK